MVAGNPVSVQSPARKRFLNDVAAFGRSAFCSGVASNVARRSRTICQGGSSPDTPEALQREFRQLVTRLCESIGQRDADVEPLLGKPAR